MRVAARIEVAEGDRAKLEMWASSRCAPVRLRERSLVVLKAAEGKTNKEIAAALGLEVNKVGRWRRRYAEEGLPGIEKERPRGGNQGGRSDAEREALRSRIVEATTTRLPKDATHWSCRSMARETAIHNHATTWPLPEGFTRHALDADGFVGERPFWGRFWESPRLLPAERRRLTALRERLAPILGRFDKPPSSYSLLHADLHPGNIIVPENGNGLHVIDFDDAGFGWGWRRKCRCSCWCGAWRPSAGQPPARNTSATGAAGR